MGAPTNDEVRQLSWRYDGVWHSHHSGRPNAPANSVHRPPREIESAQRVTHEIESAQRVTHEIESAQRVVPRKTNDLLGPIDCRNDRS
ncbi:hypothetical protein D9V28_07995 [Mycetocola zhadangensis]|uniref:Uncharacterized protein n=1 Tax=Mycetocola zhadangensis TaxID=1164595 RepID=A0A3L7J191_9MICO|nr:hypothetical protein D9V28_07995 [Mycetocola zhadangensis]